MPTKPALERFLTDLAAGNTVKHAAAEAGVARRTVYDLREKDAGFAADWQLALDEGIEVLEQEARRRAVDGTIRPVTIAGEAVTVREYSDQLLVFLLKAKKPGTYRDHFRHEHVGGDGGPIVVEEKVDVRGVLRGLVERGLIGPGANGAGDPEADEVHTA